jgi:hypothetical protein
MNQTMNNFNMNLPDPFAKVNERTKKYVDIVSAPKPQNSGGSGSTG